MVRLSLSSSQKIMWFLQVDVRLMVSVRLSLCLSTSPYWVASWPWGAPAGRRPPSHPVSTTSTTAPTRGGERSTWTPWVRRRYCKHLTFTIRLFNDVQTRTPFPKSSWHHWEQRGKHNGPTIIHDSRLSADCCRNKILQTPACHIDM